MNSLQIENIIQKFPCLYNVFVGCFMNNAAPVYEINHNREVCFIMNTVSNPSTMGHWVLFYLRENTLFFFDSLARRPQFYGGFIHLIYKHFNGVKTCVFQKQIQMDTSLVCGAYCIYFALLMSKNNTIQYIKSRFGVNLYCNDLIVKRFIYKSSRCVFTSVNLSC